MPRKLNVPRPDMADAQPFKIEGVYCRLVPLTQGQYAIVDASDYGRLNSFNWYAAYSKQTKSFYAFRTDPETKKTIRMHNDITGLLWTDHQNNVTLDYRRKNLRPADFTQSACNRRKPCSNTSGFKGVMWRKNRSRWIAEIAFRGKTIYIGSFKEKIAAAKAYDMKAIELHGEFASLNFPIKYG